MVVETLWPDNAPWWLNLFIWMATFWWYILVGFVPAFYIAVAKLFGMPLLQRWKNEVVIMLYSIKVKFAIINEQPDPYFKYGKGIYWFDQPLKPTTFEPSIDDLPPKIQTKLNELKTKYQTLVDKKGRTKKDDKDMKTLVKQGDRLLAQGLRVEPKNTIHVFSHAVNQPINKMERRQSKIAEIINNNPNPKKIPGHGIWLLENPKLHFHRHWQLIINPDDTYQLIPVKDRQQFGIGFWHSLGVILNEEVIEEQEVQESEAGSSGGVRKMIQTFVTTNLVLKQTKVVQSYQNFSASRFFTILQRRAKIESPYGFNMWVQGTFDMRIILLLGGLLAGVAMIFLMFHGGGTGAAAPATGGRPLI